MSSAPIYLDYAATTPVDPQVAQAMAECLTAAGDFGNPSSVHAYGRAAAERIARARGQVAALVGARPADVVFTSGATESNNLAILGAARANADRGRHLVTSRTEHKSVLDPFRRLEKEGFEVTWLTPGPEGRIEPRAFAAALRADTVLAALMYANNETGVLGDVPAIGALCRERGVAFHTDCAQAAGKIPLALGELPVDFAAFTAHKLYGPKGIGALYVRDGARGLLQALSYGGGQERSLRPGTLPTHQIVGFGAACALAARELPGEGPRIRALRERLWQALEALGDTYLNGAGTERLPGILNVSFAGVHGESLIGALPGLAVSSGSACNSQSAEPSYVLRALGRSTQLAQSSLRFSLGRCTTASEVDAAAAAVSVAVQRLRALSPGSPSARGHRNGWAAGAGPGTLVAGEAGGQGEETWVRFELLVSGDTVKEARFQAFACPHTMEVAAWLCGALRGRSRRALVPGTPDAWAKEHAVPAEKLGRLLRLEDALSACLAHWT
ncbi:MAG: aminotransferase class V-fold PLP-dependent enzyme [Gammaproteobacteria bacterium]|nr:aminotransferase class V-fold PLP-dependent enzyme [Gammaproteobacteria bacterium]MBV8308315.1 aminotransferase class V-fold PLP-dependent enzyme [Gammaproteobacteria bacterium]MBV8405936.1 aminotransferase class V-fold PLP-dependent enzyme [Gammaproteobacteria bacterium]